MRKTTGLQTASFPVYQLWTNQQFYCKNEVKTQRIKTLSSFVNVVFGSISTLRLPVLLSTTGWQCRHIVSKGLIGNVSNEVAVHLKTFKNFWIGQTAFVYHIYYYYYWAGSLEEETGLVLGKVWSPWPWPLYSHYKQKDVGPTWCLWSALSEDHSSPAHMWHLLSLCSL